MVKLSSIIGDAFDDDFFDFDLTEIQEVLSVLGHSDAIDLSHAEMLQQKALRGADIIAEYLGKIIKITTTIESQINSLKSKTSLNYKAPDGKTTAEMKKWAGESSLEVEELHLKLARVKGSKAMLEKKWEILIRTHHHFKEISAGMRKTILGYSPVASENKSEGWE